jgi:hypothetical protein
MLVFLKLFDYPGWHGMLVFLELLDYKRRYQNVQGLVVVIPLILDATVEVAISILVSFYLFLRHFIKWSTSSLLAYFMPKSSTTRVKEMGRVACFQRPGVCLHS